MHTVASACLMLKRAADSAEVHNTLKSALAITTALTLRAVFRLALRQTEGLVGSILALLGLDLAAPDHSTLSRRAETLEAPRPQSGTEPMHLLVDSTGSRLCGPGEWLVEKHGTKIDANASKIRSVRHVVARVARVDGLG